MTPKKTVLVDMDGVLVDLFPLWIHNYSLATEQVLFPEDITAYELGDIIEDQDALYRELDFENPPPKLGAKALNTLLADPRFDVYIVSYAHASQPNGPAQKLAWLKHYYPTLDPDRVIFTRHKHMVRGDILIEDNPGNIERWLAANPGGQAYVVEAPYNTEWMWQTKTPIAGGSDRFNSIVQQLLEANEP